MPPGGELKPHFGLLVRSAARMAPLRVVTDGCQGVVVIRGPVSALLQAIVVVYPHLRLQRTIGVVGASVISHLPREYIRSFVREGDLWVAKDATLCFHLITFSSYLRSVMRSGLRSRTPTAGGQRDAHRPPRAIPCRRRNAPQYRRGCRSPEPGSDGRGSRQGDYRGLPARMDAWRGTAAYPTFRCLCETVYCSCSEASLSRQYALYVLANSDATGTGPARAARAASRSSTEDVAGLLP